MSAIHLRDAAPFTPAASQDDNRLPAKYANHRFVFVHYPQGWSWVDGMGFLPDLSRIVAMPGVNGVARDGKANKAMAGSIEKGGLAIGMTDPRLGKWRPYMGSYPTKSGAPHWCFVKQTFTVLPGGNVREDDRSADFNEFRKHILDAGICYPMDEVVFNERIEIENRGIERLARDAEKNPHRLAKYEARVARRDAMQAWWRERMGLANDTAGAPLPVTAAPAESDDTFGAPEPTPAARGGRRKVEVNP